jgi:hypothetical protein
MTETSLDFMKIIFLLGFTLHNLEEAIWLPKWSEAAKKYHRPVESNPFIFAVIVITVFGYLLTAGDILLGRNVEMIRYIYLGFIGMMGVNAIFPHLVSTIMLKRYAPGLMTALLLNLPVSLVLITGYVKQRPGTLFTEISFSFGRPDDQ